MKINQAIQMYIDYLETLRRKSGTLYNVTLMLNRFFDYCKSYHRVKYLSEVSEKHIFNYQKWWMLENRKPNGEPYSVRVIRSELFRLCSFFSWHLKHGNILHNPTETMELPRKADPEIGTVLTHEEMEGLLEAPDSGNVVELRDRAVMELMYSSALRVCEMSALRPQDLDFQNKMVHVPPAKTDGRLVPVGKRAIHWIRKYMEESRPWLEKGVYAKPSNHPPRDLSRLFLSIFGCPLSEDGFGTRLRIYSKRAGITRLHGETHVFRRTCATHLHEAGVDIRTIQALLGHKNLEMCLFYVQVNILKLKNAHDTYHPISFKEVGCA